MASEEGWVGIADVAAHLQVARDSIYRWVETKDFPLIGWGAPSLPALGGGRVGENKREQGCGESLNDQGNAGEKNRG